MQNNLQWQAYGLIGVMQSAVVLQDFLATSMLENKSFNAMVRSIFVTQPDTVQDIYGDDMLLWNRGAVNALNLLSDGRGLFFGNKSAIENNIKIAGAEVLNNALSILMLSEKLSKDERRLVAIGEAIEEIRLAIHNKTLNFDQVLNSLNALYKTNISSMDFKIMIKIRPEYNFDEFKEVRMRILLLSGIRSAILWRQGGGTKLRIFTKRKELMQEIWSIIN